MRLFLLLLVALRVPELHGIFDGVCPRKARRKYVFMSPCLLFWIQAVTTAFILMSMNILFKFTDPPAGALVLPPGSELFLTCSGHIKVDGVKVSLSRNTSNTRQSFPGVITTTQKVISNGATKTSEAAPGENRRFTDPGHTDSPDVVHPTSSRRLKADSDWEDEEMDYEDEEGGGRVTRGIKSRPQWKWNKSLVGSGDKDWGDFTFGRSGATLTLTSVRLEDSGKYSCHHRGREKFAVKVIVAEPLESPVLICYKRSPSSKIRCEGRPQKSVIKQPRCSLFLSKGTIKNFRQLPCTYSYQHSRCWCALDHVDDDIRSLHMAFLCLTSITGNVTSNLLQFTPLRILTPDPPSNVSVHQKEGQQTKMAVTWNLPASWKQQDSHYHLKYELKYQPSKSSFYNEQVREIENRRSYTITDAMPGVEYQIQLRAKDEFDGRWSNWSPPYYARSWTTASTLMDDLSTTMLSDTIEGTGSGAEWEFEVSPTEPGFAMEVSHHVLWIFAVFAFFCIILGAYIFRHRDRFMSKLHNHSIIVRYHDSSPPPTLAPAAPEVQVLMTFSPPIRKEQAGSDAEEGEEEENEEEETAREAMDSMHFNNTSYFLLQRE
ncbi:interleukin-6 receptor subunit alpha isoform X2 [Amphiprion ocellaris]|uniref:interleukin-6 receptor subunit alpha isoform X2 n=1 Tax=Amphiprion ocellaris TaxID=80972 RepID=UPI002410C32B|nr:interleukin-6 receptor subunit alpha isoform X2 [Amphiprion ocellaris]